MLEAALEDSLAFELCDLEIRRDGPSYSVDTAKELRRLHPGAELYLIVGADTLKELHTWRNVYELLALCRVVSFGRPGMEPGGPPPDSIRLDPPWPERLRRDLSPGRMIEISSSDIRHRVAEGMSIRYLVPRAVETYIAEHGLYTGADGDSEGRG
jgi:nicotinate-nucleotide adenylyltransferase